MDKRPLGSLNVSVVGLGTNNFGYFMQEDAVAPVVDAALDAGINFFDTSDSYLESEVRLAAALGSRRDDVLIATKFASPIDGEPGGASPAYIATAVERSLRRLNTDRIDLYQIHRPDPETPIGDTLGALNELVLAGKVREIGCSNFSAAQLREAHAAVGTGGAHFVSVQNQWNLLQREDEDEAIPECERMNLRYLPFFPLASGMLTGKYRRGAEPPSGSRLEKVGGGAALRSDRNFDVVEALSSWAEQRGHSILELAFAWLAAHDVVASVIAGATSADQVRLNAAAASWRLSKAEMTEIDSLAPRLS
jgi:aryl-alcohol dehydrogenase-like predicted oxidoreductase